MKKMSWKEFERSGLLFFINQVLHVFGIALVYEIEEDGTISDVYPARVPFRGFAGKDVDIGYTNLTRWMGAHAEALLQDVMTAHENANEEWLSANGFLRGECGGWTKTFGILQWHIVVARVEPPEGSFWVASVYYETSDAEPAQVRTAQTAKDAVGLVLDDFNARVRGSLRRLQGA